MENLASRLKSARLAANMSQAKLAKLAGVSQGSIGMLETGQRNGSAAIAQIAQALGVSAIWLTEGKGEMTAQSANWDANVIPAEPPRMRVPLISWVQAGMLAEIDVDCQTGEYDEWVDVCYSKPSEQSFALTVQGDSMTWTGTPNFPEGTRIVVDPNRNPQVGDYVIAKDVGTQRATFKKLITDDVNYYLKPLNPAYPMIMIDDPSMRCIGVVVEFQPVGGKL